MNHDPKNLKVAILFANYGPYHIARIESAYHFCQSKGWSVFGIELARTEEEYPWQTKAENFPCDIIPVINDCPLEKTKKKQLFLKLLAILNQTHPDAIAISGYSRPSMLITLLWCIWHRKPAILLSETTEYDEPRSWWKEIIKSLLIKRYKAALVGGKPHKRYLAKLGMRLDAIFYGYDVVGNNIFHPNLIRTLPRPLATPYFLAINRFVTKKNLPFLISSYAAYRQAAGTDSWDLVLCGDGELRSQIEQKIIDLNLQDYVHLTGFLQQEQMLPYFAHAKCFIHASIQEQWGLVVNEAMAAGLPVLVSNRCGCYEDLIIDGINGFGFDPENKEELINLMVKMSSEAVNLESMGQACLNHIAKYSPDYFTQGLNSAITFATNKR